MLLIKKGALLICLSLIKLMIFYLFNDRLRWQTLESCGFIRVLNEMMTTTSDMSLFIKVKRLIELFSQHRFGITS